MFKFQSLERYPGSSRSLLGRALPGIALLTLGCASNEAAALPAGEAFPASRAAFAAPGHAVAYVANRLSDSVSVIDLDDFRLLGEVPVGRDPVDIDGPRHVVIDETHERAYVVLSYPESNLGPHATSLGSNGRLGYVQALSLRDLTVLGERRVEASPGDIALSDDHEQLAVSHYDTLRALSNESIENRRAELKLLGTAFEDDSSAASRQVSVCAVPASVAFSVRGDRVFVACTGEDSLVVVDTLGASVLSRVAAGSAVVNKPYALERSADGERLLLSNQVSRSVALFSTEDSPELVSEVKFQAIPYFASFVQSDGYVLALQEPDSVARVNLLTGETDTRLISADCGCVAPASVRELPNAGLFLVCEGDHYTAGTLVRLDSETLGCIEHLELGLYPERMEWGQQ